MSPFRVPIVYNTNITVTHDRLAQIFETVVFPDDISLDVLFVKKWMLDRTYRNALLRNWCSSALHSGGSNLCEACACIFQATAKCG